MDIIVIVFVLALIGIGLYYLGKVTMDNTLRIIIRVFVILCVIVWLLKRTGIWDNVTKEIDSL